MSTEGELRSAWQTPDAERSDAPPIEFFRLKDGEQASIRIVGSGRPKDIFKHKFTIEGKTYHATCPGKSAACPACVAGHKLSHANVITVLDRRDSRIKFWEFSNEKKRDIAALVEHKEYGDPRNYDLVVSRRGKGLTDTRYTLFPSPNRTPLSEAEQALLIPDLDEYYKPNPERLETLLRGEVPKRREREAADTTPTSTTPAPPTSNPLEDDGASIV